MIRNLQSLRFVFTLLVFLSHFFGRCFDFGGECGVSFFFILSGFVLSESQGASLAAGEFRRGAFLGRQVAKFVPLHLLLTAVFLLLDFRAGHWPGWERAAASALLLQSWVPVAGWPFVANGVSWFLGDLLFFYLLFPALYKAVARTHRATLVTATAVVVAAVMAVEAQVPPARVNELVYCWPPLRLPDFALGIIMHRVYRSDVGQRWGERFAALSARRATVGEVVAVAWVATCGAIYGVAAPWFRCAGLFWLMLPPVVLFFAFASRGRGYVTRLLHAPAGLWLGGVSFEIYMTHCLVKRVAYSTLYHLSLPHDSTVLIAAVSLCVTVAVAYGVRRFFVVPVATFLTRRASARRAVRESAEA